MKTLETARAALERYVEVTVDDDGAITFRHGDVPCALQGMELAEGLPVLSLTCVVAWDLPVEEDIPARVGLRAGEGLFGTLGATAGTHGWDVPCVTRSPWRGWARRRSARCSCWW